MSEYRQNATNGEWVIVSSERAKRPADYASTTKVRAVPPEHSSDCPFCKGNEDKCDPPTYEAKSGNDWKLRVVPNKFAAVSRPFATWRCVLGKCTLHKGDREGRSYIGEFRKITYIPLGT